MCVGGWWWVAGGGGQLAGESEEPEKGAVGLVQPTAQTPQAASAYFPALRRRMVGRTSLLKAAVSAGEPNPMDTTWCRFSGR